MAQGSRITDEQIETIRATYAMTGKLTDAAKASGVSKSCAQKYIHTSDDLEQLRTEKTVATIETIIVKCGEVQEKLLEALTDPARIAKASMQECATAFGIVTDKRQLLSGQATDRREHVSADVASRLTAEEMEQAAKIRERLSAQVSA